MKILPPRENRLLEFDDPERSAAFARVFGPLNALWYWYLSCSIARRAGHATRVLDLGTGPGKLLNCLLRLYPSARVVGIDRSTSMLNIARESLRFVRDRSSAYLLRASFYQLPFQSGVFDLIIGTGILHHADMLPVLLLEVRRVIVPGGRFIAIAFRRDVSPTLRALARMHSALMRTFGSDLEGLHWVLRASWTKEEIEDALARAGFRTIDVHIGLVELRVLAIG